MPTGETGNLTVTLEPDHYARIAEVPGSDTKGMLRLPGQNESPR